MTRRLLWLLPLLLAAPVAAGAALLVWQPWDDESPSREAEAAPAAMALCNVAITDVPDGVEVFEYPVAAALDRGKIYLFIGVPAPDGEFSGHDPASGQLVRKGYQALVDPRTGDTFDRFEDPSLSAAQASAAEIKLDDALDNVVPLESAPAFSAWPRTDTPPANERDTVDDITFQPPDEGAGLVVIHIRAQPPGGGRLIARTCDSKAVIDGVTDANGKTSEVQLTRYDVASDDRAMFDRFLDEVEGLQTSAEVRGPS